MNDELKLIENLNKHDKVRKYTAAHVNKKIDEEIITRISYYIGKPEKEISERIKQLDDEMDVEKVLKLQASITSALGLYLGLKKSKDWFWLIAVNQFFLFQHAIGKWCPPMAMHRRLKVRTRKEIDLEKTALKILRGDFNSVLTSDQSNNLKDILQTITKE